MTIDFASRPSSPNPSSTSSAVNLLSTLDKISILEPLVKSIPGFNWKMSMEATPVINNIIVVIKNFFRCLTILSSRLNNFGSSIVVSVISLIDSLLTPNQPFRFDKKPLSIHNPNNNLVPKTAVRKLIKILTMSIVAKPLIELVPKLNKTTAANNVVIFASIIVRREYLVPAAKADFTDLPNRNSSLIRSKVMTFASTAIPTPKIKAAIPGNVNTPFNKLNTSKIKKT